MERIKDKIRTTIIISALLLPSCTASGEVKVPSVAPMVREISEENTSNKEATEEESNASLLVGFWYKEQLEGNRDIEGFVFNKDGTFVRQTKATYNGDFETTKEGYSTGTWEAKDEEIMIKTWTQIEKNKAKHDDYYSKNEYINDGYKYYRFERTPISETLKISYEDTVEKTINIDGEIYHFTEDEGDDFKEYMDIVSEIYPLIRTKGKSAKMWQNEKDATEFLAKYPMVFLNNNESEEVSKGYREASENLGAYVRYKVFDFESDGKYEVILENSEQIGSGGDVFKNINGKYTKVGSNKYNYTYYKDNKDRLVLCESDKDYLSGIEFSYIYFDDGDMIKEPAYTDALYRYLEKNDYNYEKAFSNAKEIDDSLKIVQESDRYYIASQAEKTVSYEINRYKNTRILINGAVYKGENSTEIIDEKLYMEVEEIAEIIGGEIIDNEDVCEIKKGDEILKISAGSNLYYDQENGEIVGPEIKAIDDKYYGPAAFIINNLSGKVIYIDEINGVYIYADKKINMDLEETIKDYKDYLWADEFYKDIDGEYNGDKAIIKAGGSLYLTYDGYGAYIVLTNTSEDSKELKIAEIFNIPLDFIDENRAVFTFQDDLWGNKGYGKVYFGDEEIKVTIKITERDLNAEWGMFEGERTFIKNYNIKL